MQDQHVRKWSGPRSKPLVTQGTSSDAGTPSFRCVVHTHSLDVFSLADLVRRQRGRDARRRKDDHPPPRHEGPVRVQQEPRPLHEARHRERLLLRSPRARMPLAGDDENTRTSTQWRSEMAKTSIARCLTSEESVPCNHQSYNARAKRKTHT